MLLPVLLSLGLSANSVQGQTPTVTPPQRFAEEIRAFADADAKAMPKPGVVLFVGSSSIRLWNSLKEDFPRYRVLNRGFGGSRIDDAVMYADRIVIPYRPSAIVFYGGTNDLADGHAATQVARDWEAFVGKVRAKLPRVPIGFIAISPAPSRRNLWSQMTDANSRIRTFCARTPGLTYIDVVAAMMDGNGGPRPELFVEDQLHMNPKGYAIWNEIVNTELAGMLRRR
ncbi:hypothetical protein EON77_09655 [bacterium]|nr:MAG: hypothetical protein EON77_09655 [bacterium]